MSTLPKDSAIGVKIYELAQELFPISRSLTGNGVRETLRRLRVRLPSLDILEVPSGTPCFDWTVPNEWNIRDAWIIDPTGQKIVDFKKSNLHVVGYSIPVDKTLSLEELQKHLISLPDQPNAIPYATSYYKEDWGFCVSDNMRRSLAPGTYKVHIDSTLQPGCLTYGELVLPGKSRQEVLLSANICHPSLANNELSGPTVTTFLAQWLTALHDRFYTYRILFIPETIGAILYLSQHLDYLKEHVIAGFVITCVGDDRTYSFVPSRKGGTLADRVALHVLGHLYPAFKRYSFLDRGSDERQYCAPSVDLPVVSVMRSKYWTYPEYHNSLDNLDFVTPSGLQGAYNALQHCLLCIEKNATLRSTTFCEPQLGKRGLYRTLSVAAGKAPPKHILDVIAYSDGEADLIDIADGLRTPAWELFDIVETLKNHGLLTAVKEPSANNGA